MIGLDEILGFSAGDSKFNLKLKTFSKHSSQKSFPPLPSPTMFVLVTMTHKVLMTPSALNKNLRHSLIEQLKAAILGMVVGSYGKLVAITKILDYNAGVVQSMTGDAIYNVKFQALFFKLEKNQVVDGQVCDVLKEGIIVTVGPSIKVFVSQHRLPAGFVFNSSTSPSCFTLERNKAATAVSISVGSQVRVRIAGVRVEHNDFQAIGIMNEKNLGPISSES